MGYSADVRFTEPVDPRVVWEAVRTVVEAPNDYDWAPAQIPPAGYVEAHIWASYRYTSELVERAHRLAALVGVPAAIRDDFTGCWKPIQ